MPRHDYAQTKRRRAARRAAGKCIACCKPSLKYRCPTCEGKKNRNWNKVRREMVGRCAHCLKPLPEHRKVFKTCGWCSENRLDKKGW